MYRLQQGEGKKVSYGKTGIDMMITGPSVWPCMFVRFLSERMILICNCTSYLFAPPFRSNPLSDSRKLYLAADFIFILF